MVRLLALLAITLPLRANACGLALLLAVDVSLSVNEQEYALQTGGIAEALRDPSVKAAFASIEGGVVVSLMQWSDRDQQAVGPDWRHVTDPQSLSALADEIAATPRAFAASTAPGSALQKAVEQHAALPNPCARHVTDISGDGIANSGIDVRAARELALSLGHTINALAILGDDPRVEDYYRYNVIGGPGHFVEIANGFDDYGRAMREKLLKELPMQVAMDARP